jgi:hypothetical protein
MEREVKGMAMANRTKGKGGLGDNYPFEDRQNYESPWKRYS